MMSAEEGYNMEASLESYFDFNDYECVNMEARAFHLADDEGKKRIDKPEFDFFKFKAGDIVEIVEPSSKIYTDSSALKKYYLEFERPKYIDDTIVSIGRKYVIKSVEYPVHNVTMNTVFHRIPLPSIHVYIDRPDELIRLQELGLNKDSDSTWVNYFSIRPVPTKGDLDLNKLSPDKLVRYTELVNEYDRVINARAHQARIEQDILDLFNIPHRNKEEVLDMIKEKMEEE